MAALVVNRRTGIGSLYPDCVIEEVYEDRLQITMHPVERGAQLADHAFQLPRIVEMKVGWADYKASPNGRVGYANDQYGRLLGLQEQREPLTISTGKRLFPNMLPEAISVTHDQKSKYNVVATIRFREIRTSEVRNAKIANTATGILNQALSTVDPRNQRFPQITQDQQNSGTQQLRQTGTNDNPPVIAPPDTAVAILPPNP